MLKLPKACGRRIVMRAGILASLLCIVLPSLVSADEPAAPPTVTMHMTSVHPKEAIAEFTKQTGVAFSAWPENLYEQNRGANNRLPTSIDVNLDQATLWTAIDAIASAADLLPQNMG